VPDRFLSTVTTKAFGRTVLVILFCITLGNFVMSRVNEVQAFWLHYQYRERKPYCKGKQRTRNDLNESIIKESSHHRM
jgi:hypothetical protein